MLIISHTMILIKKKQELTAVRGKSDAKQNERLITPTIKYVVHTV